MQQSDPGCAGLRGGCLRLGRCSSLAHSAAGPRIGRGCCFHGDPSKALGPPCLPTPPQALFSGESCDRQVNKTGAARGAGCRPRSQRAGPAEGREGGRRGGGWRRGGRAGAQLVPPHSSQSWGSPAGSEAAQFSAQEQSPPPPAHPTPPRRWRGAGDRKG